jgi:3-hydroxyisobutyrate dehydrogenase-like beta-hydroxyacid dehydrogenase
MRFSNIGFIGTGVMGEPMCRNLAAKDGAEALCPTCGADEALLHR